MKYFKDKAGAVFAYETDADREKFGADELVEMTESEVGAHLNPPRPVIVPGVVSRFQARRALKDAGVFDTVEAAIAQADEFTQDAWADAQEFRRDSALIAMLGESLQLDLDALFIAAAKIEA
tara:strand:+ start:8201 stop:8566 length:366 start_codon:yes stop_codon:yes gene_type:complete